MKNKIISFSLLGFFLLVSFIGYPRSYKTIQDYKGALSYIKKNKNSDCNIVAYSLGKVEVRYYCSSIVALSNKTELESIIKIGKPVYAIMSFEPFLENADFKNDKEIHQVVEKRFKLIKVFEGEFPVYLWYYNN